MPNPENTPADLKRTRDRKREERKRKLEARARVKRDRRRARRERNTLERGAGEISRRLELDERAREKGDEPLLSDEQRARLIERLVAELEPAIARANERLRGLAKRRRELSRELEQLEGRIRTLSRRIVTMRKRRRKRRRRRSLDRVVAVDGTPVSKGIALVLEVCRSRGWVGYVTSGDRREGVAEKFGKSSQAALYRCWQAVVAGRPCPCASCNPANPPGRSTHELRDDGIYGGPVGRELEWWQLGIDATNAGGLRTVAQGAGFDLRRPYADAREEHHSNLFRNPKAALEKAGKI